MRWTRVYDGRGRRILALVLALAVVTAACVGGDDDDASSSDTAASGDGSASAEPAFDAGGDDGSGDDGGDDGSSEPVPEPEPEPEEAADRDDGASGGGADQGGATEPPDTTNPADLGRSIVFTANVDVVVEDVILATSQAKTAIAGLGGLVFGENTEIDGTARTTLEFKVFPEDFQEALNRLEGLGELRSRPAMS